MPNIHLYNIYVYKDSHVIFSIINKVDSVRSTNTYIYIYMCIFQMIDVSGREKNGKRKCPFL